VSISKRVTKNEHGDVVLTVTLIGAYDAMRFADGMRHLQCEFGEQGRKALKSIRRQIGSEKFDRSIKMFGMRKP
jgi:peptidyl-tRNA hydrolase